MDRRSVPVSDALFGRVRQRVLALLFGHPDRSFYTNEIIEWVDAGSGAVQRELASLAGAGLVTVSRIGRQKHYQANRSAPVFDELRGIVLKTAGLADVLRDALEPMQRNIEAAFVFGSLAKGADAARSDVDLMVISDRLTYADLFSALESASARLARAVNPTIYSTAELARRTSDRSPFVSRVLDGPKMWILGSDDDLPA